MAISYPVDVEGTRWAVLDVSTGEILARNAKWPVADGGEIVGLDPNYVYLQHIRDAKPSYDSRLYVLAGTEVVDADANELRLSWAANKRPAEEQKAAAENEEASKLGQFINVEREVIETRLMVGAILSFIVDQQQFPPKVRRLAREYLQKAQRVWRNRDRLDAILEQIDQGLEPDLDEGWDTE